MARLLELTEQQRERERRNAAAREQSDRIARSATRRMVGQCVALTFSGVPFYLWSWHLEDSRKAAVLAGGAFVISYVAPFLRWVVYLVRRSEG